MLFIRGVYIVTHACIQKYHIHRYAPSQMHKCVNGTAIFCELGSIQAVSSGSFGDLSYLRCNSYLNVVMLPLFW